MPYTRSAVWFSGLAESQGLLAIPLTAAQSCLWQLFIAAFGFLLIYLTLARSMPYNDGAYHAGPRQVASAALFGAAFMLQAAVLDGSSDDMLPSSLVITVLLCQFYFLTLLYLQTELFKKSAMQKEMDTLNLLYERQRQQYQVARQNVQIINRRCHELKVRIAELRHLSPAQVSAESLDEAERTARLYDAGANTGNEVLDIVLTEKTLLCQSRKIQLNAVADGSHLGGLKLATCTPFCQHAGPRHRERTVRPAAPSADDRPAGLRAAEFCGDHRHQSGPAAAAHPFPHRSHRAAGGAPHCTKISWHPDHRFRKRILLCQDHLPLRGRVLSALSPQSPCRISLRGLFCAQVSICLCNSNK